MTGYYTVDLNDSQWDVPDIYQELHCVAKGNYGQVCKAVIKTNETSVAIKRLANLFDSEFDAKTTYRELRLLKHVNHKNIIKLLDVFCPQQQEQDGADTNSLENFQAIYIVTPLVADTLDNIIYTQDLTEARIQFIVYQMLQGLRYLHSVGIIHRDIKPANIGVNEDCTVKILDFGYARPQNNKMTQCLVSLWYGAPECALNWMDYNSNVDIWSVGCIMAEMITGQPLFPGDDDLQQLQKMVDVLGKPTDDFLEKISPENGREHIESLPSVENPELKELLGDTNPLFIDLIVKMLDWDPERRFTAEQALEHTCLQDYYESEDDDEDKESQIFDERYENEEFSVEKWKELIYEEVMDFTPPEYYNEI